MVQKLIETAKDWRCISSLIVALKPGILDLIKDLNGNHVLQTCLKSLSSEENAVYSLVSFSFYLIQM